jgi:hypothetical protein
MGTNLPPLHRDLAAALRRLLENPHALETREAAKAALRRFDANVEAYEKNKKYVEKPKHVVVGARWFATFQAALNQAREEGFDGTMCTLVKRVQEGQPWEKCIEPIQPRYKNQGGTRRTKQQKHEDLMRRYT